MSCNLESSPTISIISLFSDSIHQSLSTPLIAFIRIIRFSHLISYIISNSKERLRFIYGKWSDYVKTAGVEDYEEYMKQHSQRFRVPDRPATDSSTPSTPRKMMSKLNSFTRQLTGSDSVDDSSVDHNSVSAETNGDIPKSDSSHSLDIPNSRLLWQVTPRPDYSAQYYHFTLFSMSLNQLTDQLAKRLPQTDSRFRPDVRRLEEGDLGMSSISSAKYMKTNDIFLSLSIKSVFVLCHLIQLIHGFHTLKASLH